MKFKNGCDHQLNDALNFFFEKNNKAFFCILFKDVII